MKKLFLFLLLAGLSLVAPGFTNCTATAAVPVWTPVGPTRVGPWLHVASSADGTKLLAATETAHYTSKDSGKTWTLGANFGYPDEEQVFSYRGVASADDGTKLLVVGTLNLGFASLGEIWISKDAGVTWENRHEIGGDEGGGFFACASSADGTRLVAAGIAPSFDPETTKQGFWTSADAGASWEFQPGSPRPPGTGALRPLPVATEPPSSVPSL